MAFVALLQANLIATTIANRFDLRENFYSWAQRTRNKKDNARLAQVHQQTTSPPLPPPEIDLPPPEPKMVYDTPAAGPNIIVEYSKGEDPGQASSPTKLDDVGTTIRGPSVDKTLSDISLV